MAQHANAVLLDIFGDFLGRLTERRGNIDLPEQVVRLYQAADQREVGEPEVHLHETCEHRRQLVGEEREPARYLAERNRNPERAAATLDQFDDRDRVDALQR